MCNIFHNKYFIQFEHVKNRIERREAAEIIRFTTAIIILYIYRVFQLYESIVHQRF